MLQTHFYYFLMWCGQHAESIISRIRNCFDEERAFFGQVIKEPRLIDTGVSLRLIAGILLEYGSDIGAISNASQLYDEWTNALCTALQLSEQHSKSSNPLSMYFQALFDLINSGKISVAASVDVYTANKYIGYVEKDYWWLRSRDVFLEVRKYWQNFGVTFPLSDVKISESLVDNTLILPDYEKRNGRIRILYGRKSSLPGRPRMMVLNPAAARNYLEKAHGND